METNDIKLTVLKDAVCTSKYRDVRNLTATTGEKISNQPHTGIDLVSKSGSKDLLAVADGKVLFVTQCDGSGGNNGGSKTVVIAYGGILPFDQVLLVLYAHCDRIDVKKGQKVYKNQRVAILGSTGLVTAPHVHVETYAIGKYNWCDENNRYFQWSYKDRHKYRFNPNDVLHVY